VSKKWRAGIVVGLFALTALAAVLGWRSLASPKDEVPVQARELHRAAKRIIENRGNDPAWANEVRADRELVESLEAQYPSLRDE
jgi:hypothetical protein